MDDKFLFVDPRTTAVLEYLPHEIIGQSIYKFYHPSDLSKLTEVRDSLSCRILCKYAQIWAYFGCEITPPKEVEQGFIIKYT